MRTSSTHVIRASSDVGVTQNGVRLLAFSDALHANEWPANVFIPICPICFPDPRAPPHSPVPAMATATATATARPSLAAARLPGARRRRCAPPLRAEPSSASSNPLEAFAEALDDPVLAKAAKEPVAFLGGVFAGLLRLDVKDDPLAGWIEKTSEAAGVVVAPAGEPAAAAAGDAAGGGGDDDDDGSIAIALE